MLWRQFLCLRIYCVLLNEWLRLLLIPTIFTLRTGISFCLYIVLRHGGISGWLVVIASYVGLTMLGMFMAQSYDAVTGLILMEDVVQTLKSTRERYFRDMTVRRRLYFVKLGRAVRAPRFDVGSFMEFSIEIPLAIVDEVIGQLLFLLSL